MVPRFIPVICICVAPVWYCGIMPVILTYHIVFIYSSDESHWDCFQTWNVANQLMSMLSLCLCVAIRSWCAFAIIPALPFSNWMRLENSFDLWVSSYFVGVVEIHYDHVHNDKPTPASGVFHLIEKTRTTFISPYKTRHVHLLMCGPDVTHCGEGVPGKRESVSRSQRTLAEECRVGGKCQVFPLLMQITWMKTQEE